MRRAVKAMPLVVLLVSIFAVPSVRADWIQDGVPLCTAPGSQQYPMTVSDGAGGAIVVWVDYRNESDGDIYAQRVSASGAALWTADGVALCTATGDQTNPTITSDGAGGAIVAWRDYRSGNNDIYARRVNASGAVLWTANGVALSTATGKQWVLGIISDGAGGAIVTFTYYRGLNNNDIYAQRVDASGAVQWTADGAPVCSAAGNQYVSAIASDDAGGAIVAWTDARGSGADVYAQRVDASGAVQWTADGVAVSAAAGDQMEPAIISDGAGGAIITWYDGRGGDYDIYVQRVNGSGVVQWMTDGVLLCAKAGDQSGEDIASDCAGGAIVVWWDGASGASYAQRVNASGAVQWTAEGVLLCTGAGEQWSPKIASDGAGGAILTWYDLRGGPAADIYAQRLNASGARQWTDGGAPLSTAAGGQWDPQIASDGAGGAIVTWWDDRSGENDVYAQRIDATGSQPIATLLQRYASSISDNGIRLTWTLSEVDADVRFAVLRAPRGAGGFEELSGEGIVREGLSFEFVDRDVESGGTYVYRVDMRNGRERTTLFETGPIEMPASFVTLYQNRPNPFNPSTMIDYFVPVASRVTLDVFDSSGKHVVRLVDSEERPRGQYSAEWRGVDAQGRAVGSGIYFYRLTGGKAALSKKMVLLR